MPLNRMLPASTGMAILLLAFTALGERAVPGFYLDQSIQAAHNPLGAQAVTKLFYRMPLFSGEGPLWEPAKLDFGIQNNLSPAYDLAGVFVRFEPIAFFDIVAMGQFAGYYNLLGYGFYNLESYESSTDSRDLYGRNSTNAAGFVATVAPTFKVALGPLAALNTFSASYFYADNGQGYFFERTGNVPLAKSDVEITNSAYFFVVPSEDLYVGLSDWILFVPGSGYVSHRISGVAAYTLRFSESFSLYTGFFLGTFLADRFYKNTLYLAAQCGVNIRL